MQSTLVYHNTQFALELYARLADRKGHLSVAPYSLSSALALVYAGARGKTADQMADVLHFPPQSKQLHPTFAELHTQLQKVHKPPQTELYMASALWTQQGHPFTTTFLDVAKTFYQAQLRQVDFTTAPEAVRQAINTWVERQTQKHVQDFIEPGGLDASTRLFLVNAMYFKGAWAHPFDPETTREAAFWVDANTRIQVPMMTQQATFHYMANDLLQLLELPYADNALSMLILLPKAVDGLSALEQALGVDTLDAWLGSRQARQTNVHLPKFTLTSTLKLETMLAAMGMSDAFRPEANFAGLDGSRTLSLSAVRHQTMVIVQETGTESAAVTGSELRAVSAPISPVVFRADHPFIFCIRDNRSGSILLIGRFAP